VADDSGGHPQVPAGQRLPTTLAAFDRYLREIIAEILPLSPQVIDQATFLSARYGFRTPDAIHLAAAIEHNCDLFLTNDNRLRRCTKIAVETI
jgi:predicted nucleic acid-binding protein